MIVCAAHRRMAWGDYRKSFFHPKLGFDPCFESTPVIQDILQPEEGQEEVKEKVKLHMGHVSVEDDQLFHKHRLSNLKFLSTHKYIEMYDTTMTNKISMD